MPDMSCRISEGGVKLFPIIICSGTRNLSGSILRSCMKVLVPTVCLRIRVSTFLFRVWNCSPFHPISTYSYRPFVIHSCLRAGSMIRTTTKARRLAAHVVNPSFSIISIHKHPPSSLAISRSFCAIIKDPGLDKRNVIQQKFSDKQKIRHCSHRRAMCRKNADIPGGSVDVEANREVLPTNVKPLHYDLTLEPNFEKFSYEGTVVIEYVR